MQNRYSGRETSRRNSRFITFSRAVYLLFFFSLSLCHLIVLQPYAIFSLIQYHTHTRTQAFHLLQWRCFDFKCLQVELSGCFGSFPGGVCAEVFQVVYFQTDVLSSAGMKASNSVPIVQSLQQILAYVESYPHIIQIGYVHDGSTCAYQFAYFGENLGNSPAV